MFGPRQGDSQTHMYLHRIFTTNQPGILRLTNNIQHENTSISQGPHSWDLGVGGQGKKMGPSKKKILLSSSITRNAKTTIPSFVGNRQKGEEYCRVLGFFTDSAFNQAEMVTSATRERNNWANQNVFLAASRIGFGSIRMLSLIARIVTSNEWMNGYEQANTWVSKKRTQRTWIGNIDDQTSRTTRT